MSKFGAIFLFIIVITVVGFSLYMPFSGMYQIMEETREKHIIKMECLQKRDNTSDICKYALSR